MIIDESIINEYINTIVNSNIAYAPSFILALSELWFLFKKHNLNPNYFNISRSDFEINFYFFQKPQSKFLRYVLIGVDIDGFIHALSVYTDNAPFNIKILRHDGVYDLEIEKKISSLLGDINFCRRCYDFKFIE